MHSFGSRPKILFLKNNISTSRKQFWIFYKTHEIYFISNIIIYNLLIILFFQKPKNIGIKFKNVILTSMGDVINLTLESICFDLQRRPKWHKSSRIWFRLVCMLYYMPKNLIPLIIFSKLILLKNRLLPITSIIFILRTKCIKYNLKHI